MESTADVDVDTCQLFVYCIVFARFLILEVEELFCGGLLLPSQCWLAVIKCYWFLSLNTVLH